MMADFEAAPAQTFPPPQRQRSRGRFRFNVSKYIELYYNMRRMHSSIGYNAPCDLDRDVA